MAETLYVGTLDTPHFSFVGIAKNESALRIQFSKAWAKHQKDRGNFYVSNWKDWRDCLSIQPLKVGEVARDGSLLIEVKE